MLMKILMMTNYLEKKFFENIETIIFFWLCILKILMMITTKECLWKHEEFYHLYNIFENDNDDDNEIFMKNEELKHLNDIFENYDMYNDEIFMKKEEWKHLYDIYENADDDDNDDNDDDRYDLEM